MSEPAGARACPACGTPCESDVRFCGRCGADVRMLGTSIDPMRQTDPSGALADRRDRSRSSGACSKVRYRVQTRLGQGGMGVVYRVEHVAMGKVAALKMLHPSLSRRSLEVVRRFRREAEAVSRLSHPNTVQVFDFGRSRRLDVPHHGARARRGPSA